MTYSQISVDSATAAEMTRAVAAHAAENGWTIATAVVDAQGSVLSLLRMDGVSPPIAEFALDKAYTAATMGKPTTAFADRMASSASLTLGLSTRDRLLAWGGGLPIVQEGVIIGGIGVSGARDEDDIACAHHALAAVGLKAGD